MHNLHSELQLLVVLLAEDHFVANSKKYIVGVMVYVCEIVGNYTF